MPTDRQARGFTLIELLVVISIISLIIAILLPALQGARTAAQKTGSISNVRQIQLAIHAYATDNSESLIYSNFNLPWTLGEPFARRHVPWSEKLVEQQYLATPRIYWSGARNPPNPTSPNYMYTGYGANQDAMTTEGQTLSGLYPLRVGQIDGPPPGEMIMLSETWNRVWEPNTQDGLYFIMPSRVNRNENANIFTYDGSAVRGYVDGHVVANDSLNIGYRADGHGRNGDWSYTGIGEYYYIEPWFTKWRDN